MTLIRTTQANKTFQSLVKQLDAALAVRDGDDHAFYHQFNGIESLDHVVLALDNETAVGCGAFKVRDPSRVEIKRMFVIEPYRQRGIAQSILSELETWAASLGFKKAILETGKAQVEALSFYPNMGYAVIPNFSPYEGVENSVCFEKELK